MIIASTMVGSATSQVFALLEQAQDLSPWVILASLGLAGLANDDAASIAAGLLVGAGHLSFLSAFLLCFSVIMVGDVTWFLLGRWPGHWMLRVPPVRWMLKEKDVNRAAGWFARYGLALVVMGRFLPGARTPVFFCAGALLAGRPRRVIFCMACAAATWALLLIGLAALMGERLQDLIVEHGWHALFFLAAVLVGCLVVLNLAGRLAGVVMETSVERKGR